MIMSTFKIMCVTNRRLCKEDFLLRMGKIAACKPSAIILREKDLSEEEYSRLAVKILRICADNDVECILHRQFEVARRLGVEKIHMPLPELRKMSKSDKKFFKIIGASCHSTEELVEAESLGCDYVIAGHIFATDCKKNLEPRGLEFLKNMVKASKVPIYAIGGINAANITEIRGVGAVGACIMSGFMTCEKVSAFMDNLIQGAI